MKPDKFQNNYSIVRYLRNRTNCMFENVAIECQSQGKKKTQKNHLIPKSSYLKRIANQNQVYTFDFENESYIKNNRKLSLRNIKNANTYHVLCGNHDKYLFSEIENGMQFDINNKKQLFQFALRAFIFSYSEHCIKTNDKLDKIASSTAKHVSYAHLCYEQKILEKFKQYLINQSWDEVETISIILKRKSHFISCYYGHPMLGIFFPIKFGSGKISINIFPEKDETVILLSYLKNAPGYMSMKKYYENLSQYAKKKREKIYNVYE